MTAVFMARFYEWWHTIFCGCDALNYLDEEEP